MIPAWCRVNHRLGGLDRTSITEVAEKPQKADTMLSWRNFLLLFAISVILLSRASQNDFHHGGLDLSKYHISHLQSHMHPASDMFDGVKVDRIIEILRSNLEQWGFIEGQLMEPDVNIKMPEILIPLRHLTTTLEVLGNIFYVKDKTCEARCYLERACPLLELLPVDESGSYRSASSDCYGVLSDIYNSLYNTAAGALNLDGGNKALNENKTFHTPEICDANADECNPSAVVDTNNPEYSPLDIDYPGGTPYRPCMCPSSDNGLSITSSLDNTGFDVIHQLESLRSPYEHLRDKSSIPAVDFSTFGKIGGSKNNGTKGHHQPRLPQGGEEQLESELDMTTKLSLEHDNGMVENGVAYVSDNSENMVDLPTPGLSPVMWKMLWNFVHEDDYGRREILHKSRQHYADLHSSVEEFNTEEVVSRLAIADAYLAIMHKATHEGFAFIDRELREYRSASADGLSHSTVLDEDFVSIHGELSPSESARLVVLTAFDRALTDGKVSREPERKRKGEKKRYGKQKSPRKNANPFPEQPANLNNEEENLEAGEENISTSVILLFIVAISITLYVSFLETNKRRHQRLKSRSLSGSRTYQEYFESVCEWAYSRMENGFSSAEKKVDSTSTSEKKAGKDSSAKKRQIKKIKKDTYKSPGTKEISAGNIDKSTDEDDQESDEMSDDDIELKVYESTDFASGASKSQAYEEKPEDGDDFLNEESIFRDVDPNTETSAVDRASLDDDETSPAVVESSGKKAISDAEKAKRRAERKEKERNWKKEQKEKKAKAKMSESLTEFVTEQNSSLLGSPQYPLDTGLGGLLGQSSMEDSPFNVDFSYNLGDKLDLGGVVGGESAEKSLSDFTLQEHLLPGLMAPSDVEREGNGLPFGMPNFSLFSTSLLGNDTPTYPAPSNPSLDQHNLNLDGLSAPPGLSKVESAFPPPPQHIRMSNFPVDLGLPPGIGDSGPPGIGDINLMNPLVDSVIGSDLLDHPKGFENPATELMKGGPPGLQANSSQNLQDLTNFTSNEKINFSNDEVTCQFSCRCTFFSPSSINVIQVISPQLAGPLALSRSSSDKALWIGSIRVPRSRVTFQYKYIVVNQLGILWEEERQHRIVFLKTDGDTIPLEDQVASGFVQNS